MTLVPFNKHALDQLQGQKSLADTENTQDGCVVRYELRCVAKNWVRRAREESNRTPDRCWVLVIDKDNRSVWLREASPRA